MFLLRFAYNLFSIYNFRNSLSTLDNVEITKYELIS